MGLTLDAYRIKNHIQLFMQCLCNICLSVSTVMQYNQIKDARDRLIVGANLAKLPFAKVDRHFWQRVSPGLIVCIAVSCICSTSMCGLAYGLHKEFSWALYQHVSPDVKTRRRYFSYQVYLVILKFTPFFLTAFILIYGLVNVHYMEPEFSLTIAIIPAALIHVALAVYFVRNEIRIGMAVILIIHAAEIAYLVSRIVVLYGDGLLSKTAMKDEMTLYACIALTFTVAALIAGSICFFQFNKGLKPIVLGQVKRTPQTDEWEEEYYFQRLNHNVVHLQDRESRRFALD